MRRTKDTLDDLQYNLTAFIRLTEGGCRFTFVEEDGGQTTCEEPISRIMIGVDIEEPYPEGPPFGHRLMMWGLCQTHFEESMAHISWPKGVYDEES